MLYIRYIGLENAIFDDEKVAFYTEQSYNNHRKQKKDLRRGLFEAHLCCRINRRFRRIFI